VYALVFAFNFAAFTDSTTISAFAVPVLLNNARTALVSHPQTPCASTLLTYVN
jgi:hypothetical protein